MGVVCPVKDVAEGKEIKWIVRGSTRLSTNGRALSRGLHSLAANELSSSIPSTASLFL